MNGKGTAFLKPVEQIRAAILADRQERGLTYEQLAAEIDLPLATLHYFLHGRLDGNKRIWTAIAAKYPNLVPAITEELLSGLPRHQLVGVLPAPDQPQEAPR